MYITSVSIGNEKVFLNQPWSLFLKFSLLLIVLQFFLMIAVGQEDAPKAAESPTVVEGISDATAYSIGA